ncbi:unnamed protein product, partial [Urochloa humidicola]
PQPPPPPSQRRPLLLLPPSQRRPHSPLPPSSSFPAQAPFSSSLPSADPLPPLTFRAPPPACWACWIRTAARMVAARGSWLGLSDDEGGEGGGSAGVMLDCSRVPLPLHVVPRGRTCVNARSGSTSASPPPRIPPSPLPQAATSPRTRPSTPANPVPRKCITRSRKRRVNEHNSVALLVNFLFLENQSYAMLALNLN